MAQDDTIERFYREHASSVYTFLVSLCRDRTWAEDLMHDTFAKATLAMGGYWFTLRFLEALEFAEMNHRAKEGSHGRGSSRRL